MKETHEFAVTNNLIANSPMLVLWVTTFCKKNIN